MLGSQPASFGLLAPLADDEELGFALVNSLDPAQRHAAIIHHRPPPDLAARMVPRSARPSGRTRCSPRNRTT